MLLLQSGASLLSDTPPPPLSCFVRAVIAVFPKLMCRQNERCVNLESDHLSQSNNLAPGGKRKHFSAAPPQHKPSSCCSSPRVFPQIVSVSLLFDLGLQKTRCKCSTSKFLSAIASYSLRCFEYFCWSWKGDIEVGSVGWRRISRCGIGEVHFVDR